MTPYGMLRYRGQQSSAIPPYGRCWCRLPHPVLLYSSLPRQWSPTLPLTLPHPHHYSFNYRTHQSHYQSGPLLIGDLSSQTGEPLFGRRMGLKRAGNVFPITRR